MSIMSQTMLVCRCGHGAEVHENGVGPGSKCQSRTAKYPPYDGGPSKGCCCPVFISTATPGYDPTDTLRDRFAMAVLGMAGDILYRGGVGESAEDINNLAKAAYGVADAMLKARDE